MSSRLICRALQLGHGSLCQRSLRDLPWKPSSTNPPCLAQSRCYTCTPRFAIPKSTDQSQYSTKEVQERAEELHASGKNLYPRYAHTSKSRSVKSLALEVDTVPTSDGPPPVKEEDLIQVFGRITSIRTSGSKLVFIDLVEDQVKLQVILSYSAFESQGISKDEFKKTTHLARRGDWIAINASPPYRAKNGQVSVKATSLPEIQSPCLNRFPVEQRGFATSEAAEGQFHPRHLEMLTDPEVIETFKLRSLITKTMRDFFVQKSFVEVQTPILSGLASGAVARPFETYATEFPDRILNLRIAPELWLKRLIVGGMDRVFEIGPSFRNEGLDKTHNPEFSTCEFYAVRHDLPQLMEYTQDLLAAMAQTVQSSGFVQSPETLSLLGTIQGEYQVIDFIPALNEALDQTLPDLTSPTAHAELLTIFETKSIPLPSHANIPRLLDTLSSIYLEPRSLHTPTWIINIPECLSPLAKSFKHPTLSTFTSVAARAELFISGKEVVNCYEEENSPFEQRKKFTDQQFYARQQPPTSPSSSSSPSKNPAIDSEITPPDESYLEALEWGLPPTGGWGCGIDRLVMLFSGKRRIGDVLTFGNLRSVTRGASNVKQEKEKKGIDMT
ncbi:lysine-tRNA ligase [Exophiala mesophila]|uniref:Lysine-tRNA ligase n=1 Tax=Exophiala mesophila TaxID=212818 RepID=A0A0D1ZSI1_EXOME|nr:lysine-tRNA ligase [Exophiala mesophila]KIV96874.1 lysine-tRNA ligase [Exophiala mesophila]